MDKIAHKTIERSPESAIMKRVWETAEQITRLTWWYIIDVQRIAWRQNAIFLNFAREADSQHAKIWLNYAQRVNIQENLIWVSYSRLLVSYQLQVLWIMLSWEWTDWSIQDQLIWFQLWEVSKIQRVGLQWWNWRILQQWLWFQWYSWQEAYEIDVTGYSIKIPYAFVCFINRWIWSLRTWWWWTKRK